MFILLKEMLILPFSYRSVIMRTIKITWGNDVKLLRVEENFLRKSTLKDNFPQGGHLCYKIKGNEYVLETDENKIFLDTSVNDYTLKERTGNTNNN